jgi:hypothetical protein
MKDRVPPLFSSSITPKKPLLNLYYPCFIDSSNYSNSKRIFSKGSLYSSYSDVSQVKSSIISSFGQKYIRFDFKQTKQGDRVLISSGLKVSN